MKTALQTAFFSLSILTAGTLGAQTPPSTSAAPATKVTDVMVMLTVKSDVPMERIQKILPEEVRETVRAYLDGKIREWYSRGDGKGVMFILNCKDVDEARAIMESLPLGREKLVNLEYTTLGPLTPLAALLGSPKQKP